MDGIKVSVCMTTYNQERYIAQAVSSVLAQQVAFPIELVVGEDCSTDRTRQIVQQFAERHPEIVRLRPAEKNVGGKANFLATIALCRGQYVAMLEGDDYWTCTNKLQLQVDALDAHPEWAICFHPSQCLYEDGLQGVPTYPFGWTKPVATIDDLFAANFIATGSVVFRNRLFPEFPGWFRDILIGDWPLHILNAAHGDIGFLPETMSVYRIHRAGVWSGASQADRLIAIFEMLSAIDRHFDGKYAHAIDLYRSNTIRHVIAELAAARGNEADIAEQLRRAQAQAEAQALAHARVHTQAQAYALAQVQQSIRSSCLEADLINVASHRHHLLGDFVLLEERFSALAEEKLLLQTFYDTWSKSIPYKVIREIRRPYRQLQRYLQRRRDAAAKAQLPNSTTTNKAA